MKAEQKRLADVISDPISSLKVDCPVTSGKNVSPFTLQTTNNTSVKAKRDVTADCNEIL
jgi:hypothetical protein